jgi:hypothetical protein
VEGDRVTAYDPLQICAVYIAAFAGRTDAYSPWLGDSWTAVREELTPELAHAALTGSGPIGGYVLGADSSTHVAALDFDTDNGWEEAAESLGISVRTLHAWTADGFVPSIKRGAVRLYSIDALRRWALDESGYGDERTLAPGRPRRGRR